MATDRDEQQRQQQELEEIRRSFAEMGARMGSLFEPPDTQEPERAQGPPALPPAPPAERKRPRWQLVGAAVLLVLLGTVFGWVLAPREDAPPPASAAPTPTTTAEPTITAKPETRTVPSVPEQCVE
ncbi:MAG TPA: hypothetical protein VG035_07540, partial [Actinomycetota bacterium]|nr:hypothetical protein [Actinomycetota bacterium]